MGGVGGEPAEAFQRTWSFRFSTQRPSLVPIMRQLKNAKWKSYLSHTPDCLNLLISCLPVHGHFLGSFPAPASLCPGGFCYSCSISFSRSSFDSVLAVLYCQRELFWLALSVDQHYQMLNSASTPKNVWMFIACKWHQQTNLEGVLKLW